MHTEHRLAPASTAGAITHTPTRTSPARVLVIAAAALAAVTASAGIAWSVTDGGSPARRSATTNAAVDTQAVTRDLVERGLIPAQALEPADAPAQLIDTAAVTRDLVERGLVPAQSLSED
jgi:hypothetical protein